MTPLRTWLKTEGVAALICALLMTAVSVAAVDWAMAPREEMIMGLTEEDRIYNDWREREFDRADDILDERRFQEFMERDDEYEQVGAALYQEK